MSTSGKHLLAIASNMKAVEQRSFRLAKLRAFDLPFLLNRGATRQDDLPGFAPTLLDRSFPYDSM